MERTDHILFPSFVKDTDNIHNKPVVQQYIGEQHVHAYYTTVHTIHMPPDNTHIQLHV